MYAPISAVSVAFHCLYMSILKPEPQSLNYCDFLWTRGQRLGEVVLIQGGHRAGSSTLTSSPCFFPCCHKQPPQLSWRKSIERRSELRPGDSLPSTLRSREQRSGLGVPIVWGHVGPHQGLSHCCWAPWRKDKGDFHPQGSLPGTRRLSHSAERGCCLGFKAIATLSLRRWLFLRGFSYGKT